MAGAKLRVLQLAKYFYPDDGGMETVSRDLCESAEFHSDVLCFGKRNTMYPPRHLSLKVFRCRLLFSFANAPFSFSYLLAFFFRAHHYDVVHVHAPNPTAFLAVLLYPLKITVVVHWHSDIVKQRYLKILFWPLERFVLSRAQAIVVTSEAYGKYSKSLSSCRRKLVTIPIGIGEVSNRNSVTPSDRLLKFIKGRKIAFSLGRLVYYKGFEYLVAASSDLPEDWTVVIGGGGPLESELRHQVNDQALCDRVLIAGRLSQSEVDWLFANARCFVLPSVERSEAFGVVQLEAMREAVPVISTAIPGSGVDWVNQHGVSGLVVPIEDSAGLAAAVTKMGSDDVHAALSMGALHRFKSLFSRDLMNGSFAKLYRHLG